MDDTIELVPGVRASLLPGPFPEAGVRWMDAYLCIGVAPTHPDCRRQGAGTTGSSTDAVDEWRFDAATGNMVSAYWGIPSVDAAWDDWRRVLDLPLLGAGTLRLLDRRPFVLPQAMIGAFDAHGSALICMMAGTRPREVEARIEIAGDVSLFVSGGRHCGWALMNPTDKGCLRGEELLPLPLEELGRAREPLARTLSGLFDLHSDDEAEPARLDDAALEQRLEELGAGLARRASPVAARVLMDAIERRCTGRFITRENARAPWIVARARRRRPRRDFEANDREARGMRRAELHPLVRDRANVDERVVRLHRQLRWPDPVVVDGHPIDSGALHEWTRTRPELILEWMAAAEVPLEVTGLSTLDQFSRINDAIAEHERRNHGHPLRLLDWVRLLDAIGAHAEVKAVHEALTAAEKRPPTRKRRSATGGGNRGAAAELVELELSLIARSLDDRSGDRPIARCVHCRFITHGVKPDERLARAEAASGVAP